ncbi:MAG: hypothetical protein HY735_30465 [Verrucomicrobia bacterium]|nr:hypothetical protein [Verrucomicrobiota bacterium]
MEEGIAAKEHSAAQPDARATERFSHEGTQRGGAATEEKPENFAEKTKLWDIVVQRSQRKSAFQFLRDLCDLLRPKKI